MTRKHLISKLDILIAELSEPLDRIEKKCGWNKKSQQLWIEYFENMKMELLQRHIPKADSVAYGLDAGCGIMEGRLFSRCCEVSETVYTTLLND